MEFLFDPGLGAGREALLLLCLFVALAFEFANGFHDTANAVATVIYTNTLRARTAVVLSGVCNFLGVFVGGIAVAVGIIKLLPVELLVSSGPGAGLAMVLALLLSAIAWNVGTWALGLPASSSHTLIGAIVGVGVANSLLPGHRFGDGVNWSKAGDVGLSLLISPVLGMALAGGLYLLAKRFARDRRLFAAPEGSAPPPPATRSLLVGTCAAVSFAHGSNDGQKGVGLIMLILIGLVPQGFALDLHAPRERIDGAVAAARSLEQTVRAHADRHGEKRAGEVAVLLEDVISRTGGKGSLAEVPRDVRFSVRQDILLADRAIEGLLASGGLGLSKDERAGLEKQRKSLRGITEYAPRWVLVAVALALGVGTMVGWKRIVVTVGEKIGASHLTYAQGASAELVAASTIGIAAVVGLPVSTTHVLSSGIAGTMLAEGSGVQPATVKKIALAWLLTLPATMLLSGVLFLALRFLLAGAPRA